MGIVKFGYADYQCELLRSNLYIPQGREKKEKEILQLDDVQRLFEPSDEWFHPAFCLAILTGLRPGELLGLKTSDIHGDHISIQRAINDRGYITDGKNKNARRIIPIGRLASVILNDTVERNKDLKLHTDWIFCSRDGSNGTQIAMRKSWNRLKEERNLPGTPYSLRHTFISLMKNVMPEQMVKDIVGHSASMPTFEVYGHILDGESICPKKQTKSLETLTVQGFALVEAVGFEPTYVCSAVNKNAVFSMVCGLSTLDCFPVADIFCPKICPKTPAVFRNFRQ